MPTLYVVLAFMGVAVFAVWLVARVSERKGREQALKDVFETQSELAKESHEIEEDVARMSADRARDGLRRDAGR